MYFISHAGALLEGSACDVCTFDVSFDDPVFYDVDGDDQRVRITVLQHKHCHYALQVAADKAAAAALTEAAHLVLYNDKADALIAIRTRADALKRKLEGHSGADVVKALGLRAS